MLRGVVARSGTAAFSAADRPAGRPFIDPRRSADSRRIAGGTAFWTTVDTLRICCSITEFDAEIRRCATDDRSSAAAESDLPSVPIRRSTRRDSASAAATVSDLPIALTKREKRRRRITRRIMISESSSASIERSAWRGSWWRW